MSTCVCPGSYDPVTLGHLDVVQRAAAIFESVVIAVVDSSVRKSKPLFDIEERLSFIEEAVQELGLHNVRAERFDVLVVEFAQSVGATAIVKGLRAVSDYEYEAEMAQLNRNEAPDVESLYLMASPQYSFLSSSGIKDMATFGGDISRYVPPRVAQRLQEELTRQRTTR
jgi:pantetheine-phosphate adenylyltransferase